MGKESLRLSLFASLAVVMTFATTGVARAQLSGRTLITASGGATDGTPEYGHLGLAGVAVFNNKGGASFLNITLSYQDSAFDGDGFTCVFTQPGDLSYSFPNGARAAGTLTFTHSASDPLCYQTTDPTNTSPETGKSVSFNVYAFNGGATLAGTTATLFDPDDPSLYYPIAVAGTIQSVPNTSDDAMSGTRLISADGGTTDNNKLPASDAGHMGIAGRVAFTQTGGASALDVTLSYQDSENDGFVCELTNPGDLSYSLNNGIGWLTLTVSSQDTGCLSATITAGQSITFALYKFDSNSVVISTASTLHDTFGDVIDDPDVVGSFLTFG